MSKYSGGAIKAERIGIDPMNLIRPIPAEGMNGKESIHRFIG
jgi:hypothetical protein